jgi:hypothetical protein
MAEVAVSKPSRESPKIFVLGRDNKCTITVRSTARDISEFLLLLFLDHTASVEGKDLPQHIPLGCNDIEAS